MKYPKLSEMNTSREWLDTFGGYNHNLKIGEGEFYEMTNLSSDNYPILSPRPKRSTYSHETYGVPLEPQGLVAKDSLCYVDGSDFIINEYRVPMELTVDRDEEGKIIPKTLISMGAYVIIMPDKKYINTKKLDDYGDIEATFKTVGSVKFELCTIEGAAYENTAKGNTPPTITDAMLQDPSLIPFWLDTSEGTLSLKMYSTTSSMWTTVPTVYIKISNDGIGLPFSVHDGVTIKGVEGIPDLKSPTSTVIWAKDDRTGDNGEKISNWIVVKGILDQLVTQTSEITITREMPYMDFIIESKNRLWGCRYGVARNGTVVNEIYASKLGDFKNWNCFMGISTDSYVISVGTDGQFTGAITLLGYPLFFKENCMHKVYGDSLPFGIQDTACRGVQMGCERSLAIVNEVLYYKARTGICAYDGSLPVEISSALGDVSYSKAVAGALGNKYYVSMKDNNDDYHLFVYDTFKGMWHREDSTEVLDFCNCRGDLYYIDWSKNQIRTIRGTVGVPEEGKIRWSAVTGIIGTDSPDKKYISRIDIRMKLDPGTRVMVLAEYDSSGALEYLLTMTGNNLQSFAVPIRPRRCDHLRLHISGEGNAKIYSICKTVEWGSDV